MIFKIIESNKNIYIIIEMKESPRSTSPTNPLQQNHAKILNARTAFHLEVQMRTEGI